VSLWRHFPVDDQSPETLAASIAAFQRFYDFDFIKVTPASSFCLRDWGCQDAWKGNPEGTREITRFAIRQPEDWTSLKRLNPRMGSLGAQLRCLEMLTDEFSRHTPILQTIFSPLAQAKNLAGKENLLWHLRKHPDALRSGLETITSTTLDFIRACKNTGIDGIFYAVQHASFNLLSRDEFDTFCRPYDLRILAETRDFRFNVGHIHGEQIMFDAVKDYPVQVLNWHDQHTEPSLENGLGQISGAVCGGLRQWETLVLGDPETVAAETRAAVQATGGIRFILGTGCVVPITAPSANLMAARRAVEAL
jgi:uroporphyrinogen decarboxylase